MHRIVHFDLKGAPLKVNYLEKVILSAKSWGATGVLFEWEDTFPYSGEVEIIGSKQNAGGDQMYSDVEVQHILQFVKDNGLLAIQLVQTIGHLEYVLKHPSFSDLREDPKSPAVLCPSNPKSLKLVKLMLDQALDMQPNAEYFHIGADEVWHMGLCKSCQNKAEESDHKIAHLYLDYIQKIALFVKQKRPNIKILAWDDMLKNFSADSIKAHQIHKLVQPVIWSYYEKEHFRMSSEPWFSNFRGLFPNMWAASAFKGANGSCQMIPDVRRYVSNHEAWRNEFNKLEPNFKFDGIILTGWSRYDHYATLCELMPVALPSLACCLKTLTSNAGTVNVLDDRGINEFLATEEWPGVEISSCLHRFVDLKDKTHRLINGNEVATWLNPWQVEKNFTNPTQIAGITATAKNLFADFMLLQTELTVYLRKVTGERSVDEYVNSFVTPIFKQLYDLYETAHHRSKAEPGLLNVTALQGR